ncbi:O-antigen polymerase [Shewanella sp.]|uniref:O-antigen polymerase n=1 Tax=Shewanella sp. TaxID=50422 RepID=UPI0040488435
MHRSNFEPGKYFIITLLLACWQIIGLVISAPLVPSPSAEARFFVFLCYVALILTLLFFIKFYRDESYGKNSSKKNEYVIIIYLATLFVFVFQGIPAVRFALMLGDLSLAELRTYSIYGADSLKDEIYFGKAGFWISRYFATDFSWLLLCLIIFANFKFKVIIISILAGIISISSLVIGGRSSTYFLFIILFMFLISKHKLASKTILRYAFYAIIFLLVFSVILSQLRSGSDESEILTLLNGVFRYHYIPSIMLSVLVETPDFLLMSENIPFNYSFGSVLMPFHLGFGDGWRDVPQLRLFNYLNEPILYAEGDYGAYNAFGTIFSSLFLDFGFFAPLFVPLYISLHMVVIRFSKIKDPRPFYLWFSLLLYQSMFQPILGGWFSTTVLLVLIGMGLINRIAVSLKYIIRY